MRVHLLTFGNSSFGSSSCTPIARAKRFRRSAVQRQMAPLCIVGFNQALNFRRNLFLFANEIKICPQCK